MPRNKGRQPGEAFGRKVHVLLWGGWTNKKAILSDPWPADDIDWTISDPPHPYQIKAWELV